MIIPVIIRVIIEPNVLYSPSTVNSVVGALLAITFGYFAWRRIGSFATVEASNYVLWSFLPFFALVMLCIILFRIDYSRSLLFASAALTQFWFIGLHLWVRSKYSINLGVIEGGGLKALKDSGNQKFITFEKPKLEQRDIDGVVIDLRHNHNPEWLAFITELTLAGVPVFHHQQIEEDLTGQVSIEHLYENSFGSLLPNLIYLRIKNRLEQILALISLPIVLPICLVTALAILLIDGRPIIFSQSRMGFRGKPFTAYKFRTMKIGSADLSSVEDVITKEGDPRITKIGAFLRKYRIDELPQVVNIIRGEMGWIGPRPEAVELSEMYEKKLSFYRYRHAVRPGITGWAQVNQGHVTSVSDIDEKLKYDFYYIKNISFWMDFLILLKTVRIVFFGIGAK